MVLATSACALLSAAAGLSPTNQHSLVKVLHDQGCCAVVDLPQRRHHARRAGVEKPARQPDETFALDLSAAGGLARAQHDQVCPEPQIVDVVEPKKAVLRSPGPVDQRQHHARQFRSLVIEQAVSGEMHDPILPEVGAQHGIAAGIEIERHTRQSRRCQTRDFFCFMAAETQPQKLLHAHVVGRFECIPGDRFCDRRGCHGRPLSVRPWHRQH